MALNKNREDRRLRSGSCLTVDGRKLFVDAILTGAIVPVYVKKAQRAAGDRAGRCAAMFLSLKRVNLPRIHCTHYTALCS